MKYFAYGSNMLPSRLKGRITAKPVGITSIKDFTIAYNKLGKDGSGKCNIFRAPGKIVHGAIFEIDPSQIPALDDFEKGYDPIPVTAMDGKTGEMRTYQSNPARMRNGLLPNKSYFDLVLAGAMKSELPEEYITFLSSFACSSEVTDGDIAILKTCDKVILDRIAAIHAAKLKLQ